MREQISQDCLHPAPASVCVAKATLKGDEVTRPVKYGGELLPGVFYVLGVQQRKAVPAHQLFGSVAGDLLGGRTGVGHGAIRGEERDGNTTAFDERAEA